MVSDQSRNQYSWLETTAVRNASDVALGCVLVMAAVTAILGSRGLSVGPLEEPGPGFFPILLGWLLAGTGMLLLARGALGRAPQPTRWTTRQLLLLIGFIAAVILGRWLWLLGSLSVLWGLLRGEAIQEQWLWFWGPLLRPFGPAESAAAILLVLSIGISVSRLSRLRALGLVLLGLLLTTVGMDPATGVLRFTMGVEQLLAGFDFLVVAPGLILVADGLVCLVSPALLLATYTRRMSGWRDPTLRWAAALAMRVVAVLVIAASCYLAFRLMERVWDIGLLGLFGVLGVASKMLGWNRLVLILGLLYGERLEEAIRQTVLLTNGDILAIAGQPLAAALVSATALVLVTGLALSLRRGLARP